MFAKIGSFFEAHIEKIVFALIGLMCVWLLIFHVLFSPNTVTYSNEKFSPSKIDKHILKQTNELKYILNQPPEPKPDYVSRFTGALDPNDPVRKGVWGDLQHGFDGLFACAINGIRTDLSIPQPPPISSQISDGKQYALQLTNGVIGEVTDVAAEHVRAAAYVPTQPVTEDVPYEKAALEPDDLDLVTVEAKFDVAQLYRMFHESFDSDFVQEEWRDPCLAAPVFAAVQLQRQEQLDNGGWSDWLTVPRSKIDTRKRIFEIVENIEDLPPGGIAVRLLQFNEPDVRTDLLQPQSYQIASANEEWFPPSLHSKFLELKKKEKTEQKREEMQARKEEAERQREQGIDERRGGIGAGRSGVGTNYEGYGGSSTTGLRGTRGSRSRRPRSGRTTGRTDTGAYSDTGLPGGGRGAAGPYADRGSAGRSQSSRGGTRASRSRRADERNLEMDYEMAIEGRDARTKPSSDDIFFEFEDLLITAWTDLSKMREPLVFWALDDTVEPGKTYRYRVRLGVYNPIAGTNKFKPQSKTYKDKVILWSEFSDITKPVDTPRMLYLFAKDVQQAAKMVTIQVSKFVLGYWYSEDFAVRQGEVIGKPIELEDDEGRRKMDEGRFMTRGSFSRGSPLAARGLWSQDRGLGGTAEPESIDYSTDAVLVDAVEVSDWHDPSGAYASGGAENLRVRHYFDMLYSFDGTTLNRMAISNENWPQKLQTAFNQIRRLQKEPKEPLKAFRSGAGGRRRSRQRPGMDIYERPEGMSDEYDIMLEEMMGPY